MINLKKLEYETEKYLIISVTHSRLCSSCNDEWENEQFTHYISFKAPINSDGVSRINVRYRSGNEKTTFQLPIIVSGSTTNERNITVHVGLDTDTLKVLNQERFNNRTDLYYQVLPKKFYSHSETVLINAGQDVAERFDIGTGVWNRSLLALLINV